jgi:hypothetical protein
MKIVVTDTQAELPSQPRQQIVVTNTGSKTAYWGWERTTAASGANQGLPLDPGAILSFGGQGFNVGAPLFFICATGETTDILYTQR